MPRGLSPLTLQVWRLVVENSLVSDLDILARLTQPDDDAQQHKRLRNAVGQV